MDTAPETCDWGNHTLAECMEKSKCDVLFMKTMLKLGMYMRYYGLDSFELLDEKIAVMTALVEGKGFYEMPGSKRILERMIHIEL